MTKIQAFLSILVSQLFCWLGAYIDYTFNTLIIFPFLFGISLPIANWTHVKNAKWRTIFTLGIMSIALFFGGGGISLWFASIHLILGFVAVGLTGVAFLNFNSALISNIHINKWAFITTFVLVAISLPIGKEILKIFNKTGQEHLYIFSTFFTVLGICLSSLRTNQVEEKNANMV